MCPIWQSNCRIFDEVSTRGEEAPEGRRASLLRARTVSFGRHNRHRREPPESRAVTSAGRMVSSLFRSDKSGNPAYILVEKVRSKPMRARDETGGIIPSPSDPHRRGFTGFRCREGRPMASDGRVHDARLEFRT